MDKEKEVNKDNKNVEVHLSGLKDLAGQEKLRVCPVCGHANSISTGQCKMCSSYLF